MKTASSYLIERSILNLINKMNTEEKMKQNITDNVKIQKEESDYYFKREAKKIAINNSHIPKGGMANAETLIIEAEKIYQWLIKDL